MSDYGKKVATALQAVRNMHLDVSRLLTECDEAIGDERPSVFGSYVTKGLTYSVTAKPWMVEDVYRFYDRSDKELGLVEAVTVDFLSDLNRFGEPLIVVGQLRYRPINGWSAKDGCDGWDLYNGFFRWNDRQTLDEVQMANSKRRKDIEWIKLIAAPLFEVKNMQYIVDRMERVRQFELSSR